MKRKWAKAKGQAEVLERSWDTILVKAFMQNPTCIPSFAGWHFGALSLMSSDRKTYHGYQTTPKAKPIFTGLSPSLVFKFKHIYSEGFLPISQSRAGSRSQNTYLFPIIRNLPVGIAPNNGHLSKR